MKLTFEVHSDDLLGDQAKRYYRAAAAFFLHAIGELEVSAEDVPTGTGEYVPNSDGSPFVPPPPPTVHATAASSAATAPVSTQTVAEHVSAKPAAGNVVNGNFPQAPPPPPPPVDTAMVLTTLPIASTPSATAAPASSVSAVSAEPPVYDKSGMPWDERIHQRGKNTKKDGTWKLRKLVGATTEQIAAFDLLVQQVVQEHAHAKLQSTASANTAKLVAEHYPTTTMAPPPPPPPAAPVLPEIAARIAALNGGQYPVPPPPPPPPVGLSPGGNGSVPVPPVPNGAAASMVPPPPPSPSVPAAPSAPAGDVSGQDPFKLMMDVIMSAIQQQKIKPDQIPLVLQHNGAPNLSDLSKMPHLIPAIKEHFEGIIAGSKTIPGT